MDAEYSLPPPEIASPAPEFRAGSAPEYAPLPPEYGQRTAPDPELEPKKRRLRKLLAVPAILLLGFLFLHAGSKSIKPSTAPDDLPKGSVVIDVIDFYTNVEGDTLNYRYQLYLRDTDGENVFGGPDMPYPISVTASVTDEDGASALSPENPDVWTEGRSLGNHSIDVTGLKGDLLLRLRAEYTQQGEQRQTTVYVPLSRSPGLCTFMIDYAMLDLSTRHVEFDYWVDRSDSSGMIVPVTATIIDSEGRVAHPSVNPVMWSSDPNLDPDCKWADATDLNDNLTLILRTEYTGSDGKAYQSVAARQVVIIGKSAEFSDFEPACDASITSLSRNDVSFSAQFRTTYRSGSYFDMIPNALMLVWVDQNSEEVFRDYLDPEIIQSEKSYDPAKSPPWGEWPDWSFSYSGKHWFYDESSYRYDADAVDRACEVYAELTLINRFTGRLYTVRTDSVSAPDDSYPLGDGEIVITVYNDTTVFEFPTLVSSGGYLTVLERTTIAEADFTSYTLPSALVPDGYDFVGWVIHVGNPFTCDAFAELYEQYGGDPPVGELLSGNYAFAVGSTLTQADIERVPPSADGKRWVDVHAVWISPNPSQKLLYLDDGFGGVTGYAMDIPLASEGYLYLCRYPEPERDGYVFDGWYDADGRRVEMLVCYFSFTPMTYTSDGSFTGYDWSAGQQPITLTAHWR